MEPGEGLAGCITFKSADLRGCRKPGSRSGAGAAELRRNCVGVAGLARFPFDILSRNARSLGVLVIYGSFADADARAAETTGWPAAVDVCAALLAAALLLALYALYRLDASRREMLSAHGKLASLTQRLKSGESTHWRETGVADVDAIAHTLEEFDQRLRHKRAKLVELNQELIKSDGLAGSGGFDNLLRAIIDAMPVGVLVAEAPSGRILEGNRAVETILGHPVIYSEDVGAYERRPAAHENGAPLSSGEFPLARALAGEERPTLECRYQRGDGEWIWINIVGAPIRNERNEVIGAIAAITDIDDIKTAEERGRQMNLELHHRVNNALAMIQGIANITARSATSFECFRSNFNDRIHCLSRISTLLVKKSWTSTPMRELVAVLLSGLLAGVITAGPAAAQSRKDWETCFGSAGGRRALDGCRPCDDRLARRGLQRPLSHAHLGGARRSGCRAHATGRHRTVFDEECFCAAIRRGHRTRIRAGGRPRIHLRRDMNARPRRQFRRQSPFPTRRRDIALSTRQCVPSLGSSVRRGRLRAHSCRSAGFWTP